MRADRESEAQMAADVPGGCRSIFKGSSGISVGFFIGRNCEGFVLFPLPLRERARVRGFQ